MTFAKPAFTLAALTAIAAPAFADMRPASAPEGTADTRYCMRVTVTGMLSEPVKCWTRDEWAVQGVDVDLDWPREGVRVIG